LAIFSTPPDPRAGSKGTASRQEGNGEEGREGLEGGGRGEWRGKGEVEVIAPWLLRG